MPFLSLPSSSPPSGLYLSLYLSIYLCVYVCGPLCGPQLRNDLRRDSPLVGLFRLYLRSRFWLSCGPQPWPGAPRGQQQVSNWHKPSLPSFRCHGYLSCFFSFFVSFFFTHPPLVFLCHGYLSYFLFFYILFSYASSFYLILSPPSLRLFNNCKWIVNDPIRDLLNPGEAPLRAGGTSYSGLV
jgi:hypothetical protein